MARSNFTKSKGKAFPKGKIPQKGNNSRVTREPDTKISKEKYNDPTWYIREGQLAKDVASLSFNNALGGTVRFEHELTYLNPRSDYTEVEPGIMVLLAAPAVGISGDGSSPINIAAQNIYSYVRHQNSGHSNYEATDLMMYLGAMDSVYSFIATLMRVYGTARTFSQVNRYVGDALIRAQGFNPVEIRQNLSDFRSYINMFITKASAFCTPNIMTLYKRHFWMFSGVYKDEDIAKSQMYIYRPACLWKYNELDGAGRLVASPFTTTIDSNGFANSTTSLSQVYTFGNEMLNNLIVSEDINIMSGDILKAYGQANLWSLGLIDENYVVMPAFSDEVLDQIHNTTFVGNRPTAGYNQSSTTSSTVDISGLDVYQITDPTTAVARIVFSPEFIGVGAPGYSRIVDLHYEDPSAENVLVATRNAVMGATFSNGDTYTMELSTCGSDICLYASIYTISTTASAGVAVGNFWRSDSVGSPAASYFKFKRAPLVYAMTLTDGGGRLAGLWGDVDNYTLISFDDLKRMHESAILSMLGVPFYGVHA